MRLAHADDASDAEVLFNEGQQAKEAGNTAEACAKFKQSLEKNRNAVGTILNVALCFEEEGKIASAYKLLQRGRDLAHEGGFAEHEKAARRAHVEDRRDVPHVAIAFAEQAPDTKLVIDDKIVEINAANDIEIDPGTRTIVVSAPGRVAVRRRRFDVKARAQGDRDPQARLSGQRRPRRTSARWSRSRAPALVLAGIGVGIYANHQYNAQFDGSAPHCMNPDAEHPTCDQTGYTKTQQRAHARQGRHRRRCGRPRGGGHRRVLVVLRRRRRERHRVSYRR